MSYIEREYVIKCMDDSYKNAGISAEAKAKMTRWLNKAPAADVRPVVMCRDCVNYGEMLPGYDHRLICHKFALTTKPDDFCSRGEKREER